MGAGGQRDSRLRTLWNRSHSLWSSFDVGPAHVLLLDSEAILWCNSQQNESAMLTFAEADLSAAAAPAARALRPWIVVVVHRPLYSSFNSTGKQAAMRAPLAPLLARHRDPTLAERQTSGLGEEHTERHFLRANRGSQWTACWSYGGYQEFHVRQGQTWAPPTRGGGCCWWRPRRERGRQRPTKCGLRQHQRRACRSPSSQTV